MRAVCDTGPLVAAADRSEAAHRLAALVVTDLGRDLVIPEPVLVETDHLLRNRLGSIVARAFLTAVADGEHTPAFLSPGLLRRAVAIDAQFADLELGLADAAVMAYAERHDLPILTFDFAHFRATHPRRGQWRLVIEERHHAEATGG
ncbi:MAG TPA: PIN domain-containing protein [Geminicoccaceae bacterium]|nr:PIN domain-containing protein [Geminicoccaceae bacterium]